MKVRVGEKEKVRVGEGKNIRVCERLPGCAAPLYVSLRCFNNKAWGPQASERELMRVGVTVREKVRVCKRGHP